METRSVAVYCSSAAKMPDWLCAEARVLGAGFAERGWRLVYGGASLGTMGILADAVLESGGRVLGVIPRALVNREIAHPKLTELRVVDTMHERKATMFAEADAFVALPGGLGTVEELLEMLTWKQLGIHGKPIIIVNPRTYFDALLAQFERGIADGLIRRDTRVLYAVVSSASDVFPVLADPPVMPRAPAKWY